MHFIWRHSVYAPLVALQTSSNFRILPMYTATVIHQRWRCPLKFSIEALEENMATLDVVPDLPRVT
jgi:hypothetical protein